MQYNNRDNFKKYLFALSFCSAEYGTTYGFVCTDGERTVARVIDLSCDRSFAEAVVSLLNDAQPSPAQLPDVIEDLLP